MGKNVKSGQPPEPPQAGPIRRRFRMYPYQAVGMAAIVLVPILALLQVFDTTSAQARVARGGMELQVEYPSRLRDRTRDPLLIRFQNHSGRVLRQLDLRMDRSYFSPFEEVTFTPSAEEAEGDALIVRFRDVPVGGTRTVEATFRAEQSGWAIGSIRAVADGVEGPPLWLKTFVLP